MANLYFLLLSVFQCVPQISNTFGVPTILLPLSFVILVDAVFAALEVRGFLVVSVCLSVGGCVLPSSSLEVRFFFVVSVSVGVWVEDTGTSYPTSTHHTTITSTTTTPAHNTLTNNIYLTHTYT